MGRPPSVGIWPSNGSRTRNSTKTAQRRRDTPASENLWWFYSVTTDSMRYFITHASCHWCRGTAGLMSADVCRRFTDTGLNDLVFMTGDKTQPQRCWQHHRANSQIIRPASDIYAIKSKPPETDTAGRNGVARWKQRSQVDERGRTEKQMVEKSDNAGFSLLQIIKNKTC